LTALALAGWLLAFAAGVRLIALRRRLELVACAEHELRGPLAALTLGLQASRRPAAGGVEAQLERVRLALADLAAARSGLRARPSVRRVPLRGVTERVAAGWTGLGGEVSLDWRAGDASVEADPARLSQALGNLLSNALEHGGGRVALRGLRDGDGIRIEVRDGGPGFGRRLPRSGRGRGLRIAARAVEEAGGRLRVASDADGATVAVELPIADI
jgi:two-component system sensor histidine kinase BaeS